MLPTMFIFVTNVLLTTYLWPNSPDKRDLDAGVGGHDGHGGGLDGGYGVGDLDGVGGRDLYRGDPVEESGGKAGRRGELMEFFIIVNVAFTFIFSGLPT